MNEKQNLAYYLFSLSQLMIECLDELEGTKLSSKKERNLMKRVQQINEGRINAIHKEMDTEQQISLNDMIKASKVSVLGV